MVVSVNLACSIMEAFGKDEAKDNFCDFTVIVEGRQFGCHRFILNACSGFFSALLRSGMKETLDSTVTLYGMSSDIFALILKCFYSGEDILTDENIIDIWHAAHLLQVSFLVTECEKFIIQRVSDQNYMDIYRQAKILNSGSVLKATQKVMLKEFGSLSFSPSFIHVYPEDLQGLIESDELNVPSEDVVVDAIMTWVSSTPDTDSCNMGNEGQWQKNISSSIRAKMETVAAEPSECKTEEIKNEAHNREQQGQNVQDTSSDDGHLTKTVSQAEDSVRNFNAQEGNNNSSAATEKADLEDKKDCSVVIWHQSENHPEKDAEAKPRKALLGKLLKACRLCLVSSYSIESLMNSELVMESKESLMAVREAVIYQLKSSPFWPSSAIHRTSSNMENVAVFVSGRQIKAYSMQKNRIYAISGLPEAVGDVEAFKVANNQLFLVCSKKSGYYSPSFSLHVQVSPSSLMGVMEDLDSPQLLIPHGEFMYIGKGSKLYRFNLQQMWGDKTPLSLACPLPVNLHQFTSLASATIGRKVILFCGDSVSISVSVWCIDTQTFRIKELDNLDGPAEKMVTFGDAKNSYVLQENGTLLMIVDNPAGGVDFVYMTKLWGFDWSLLGAVVYRKVLFLFGGSASDQRSWSSNLPGYFDQIRVIHVRSTSQCLPIVLPRQWMLEKT